MTGTPVAPHRRSHPRRRVHGLRSRLWFACLAAALAAIAGLGVIAGVLWNAGGTLDSNTLLMMLGGAAAVSLLVGMIAAAWVVRGIAGSLDRLDRGLEEGHLGDHASGIADWGELGNVARHARALLETQRELARSRGALAQLQDEVERVRSSVERWMATERWDASMTPIGPSGLAAIIGRCFTRHAEVADQNHGAANLVRDDLLRVADEAREASGLAEHGYIEATALLTTLAEIARLTGELQPASAVPPPSTAPIGAAWRARTADALEELVQVSSESVAELGSGLAKVQEIGTHVQLLSNRATLIALDAIVGTGRAEGRVGGVPVIELKELAAEVRTAHDRVAQLTTEVESAAARAQSRMQTVREHVLARLDESIETPPAPAPPADLLRLVARLREMVQDARRKGERLSSSNERASAATQRVTRRLDDELRDLEGLVVRLTPTGITPLAGPPTSTRRLSVLEGQAPSSPSAESDTREERS